MDLGAKVWRRHGGITSSYSVSFAFCGEFLRCNAGVALQVRCGSSLRSLQPGGGVQELLWWLRLGQASSFPGTGWSLMLAGWHSHQWVCSFRHCPPWLSDTQHVLLLFYREKGYVHVGILLRLGFFWRLVLQHYLFLDGFSHIPSWTPEAMNELKPLRRVCPFSTTEAKIHSAKEV